MPKRIDKDTCRKLFLAYGGWFGSPRIYLHGELIDGRVRREVSDELGLRTGPDGTVNSVRLTIDADAVRFLCLVGHYSRAREYLPDAFTTAQDAAAYCACEPELVAPLFVKRPRICPQMKPHTTPRRRDAIKNIARLYRAAKEGTGFVSADQILEVMRPWF